MRQNATLPRRLACLLLAVILAAGLFPLGGVFTAFAEDAVLTMTNVVVFVRLNGEKYDDFNRRNADGTRNESWETIRGQYDTGTSLTNGENNSFAAYIRTISEGRVQVKNVFPQVNLDTGEIHSLELSKSVYVGSGNTGDEELVTEVVRALSAAQNDPNNPLYLPPELVLDNREHGVLDNLTIILQGMTFNGKDRSFKGNYFGEEEADRVRGIRVASYNAMPSGNFIDVTQPDGTTVFGSSGAQGVAAHEFLHTMGLFDLYRLESDGVPVGLWDIMASPIRVPQYPLGYQRKSLNWMNASEVQEISQSGDYTLRAVSHPGTDSVKLITIKTPLSESASETICLEYRRAGAYYAFEYLLPDSGLLLYRVDEKVEGKTNLKGKNYIYIYRPGVTVQEDATDTETITDGSNTITHNRVYGAALGGDGASYGSTDLSADFTQNTLYYSTGRNSGVQISNLKFSGDTVSFHVEFAQYGDTWQPMGGAAAENVLTPRLYADEATGALYLAYIDQNWQAHVNQWNAEAGAWQPVGGTVGAAALTERISLASCGGTLYVAYKDSENYPVYASWNGGAWSTPRRIGDELHPRALQLVTDGNGVYAAYEDESDANAHRIVIRDINGGIIAVSPVTAADFCNPTVVKDGSKFYVAYTKFGEGTPAQIDAYDMATQSWQSIYTYQSAQGSANLLTARGGRLYALSWNTAVSGSGSTPALAVWDGSGWTEKPISGAESFYEINLTVAGQTPYVSFIDQRSARARLLRLSGGQWESCYDGLNGTAEYFQAVNVGTQVYVAVKAPNTGVVNVYAQQVTLAPDDPTDPNRPSDPVTPPPADPDTPVNPDTPTDPDQPANPDTPENPTDPNDALTLRLTPPSGYTDTKIYVDGVAYDARQEGGLAVTLPNTSGKIATMYYYNERGIPRGMYVWRLSHDGAAYTATPLPGLQDLISYHGFSIRVQSPAGIRFKSGIDTGLRARLLADGVDGYTLAEYGTMSIAASNLAQHPFVLGEDKVRSGRSYWTENGVVNDRILETVDGRYRFASVIINIPQEQYASEIAFRAYAILRDAAGNEAIVYGPYVTRSVYYVAKQVDAAGEFAPGSGGHQYIQGILQAVEQ